MQFELAHVVGAAPVSRSREQRPADALSSMLLRDHQADVRDMPARRMLVTRDREAADDRPVLCLRYEDRRVRIAPDRTQVAPLVADVPPAVRRREPSLGLRRDIVAERLQRLSVPRVRGADDEAHCTTTPAPPRRGSPAAASSPPTISTAAAPPKYRFLRDHLVTSQPSRSSRSSSSTPWPPSQWRCSPSRWTRGLSIASRTSRPCWITLTTTCITAPRAPRAALRDRPAAAHGRSRSRAHESARASRARARRLRPRCPVLPRRAAGRARTRSESRRRSAEGSTGTGARGSPPAPADGG